MKTYPRARAVRARLMASSVKKPSCEGPAETAAGIEDRRARLCDLPFLQALRPHARTIVEFGGNSHDPLTRLRVDLAQTVEGMGDRRPRDSGLAGDIGDRRAMRTRLSRHGFRVLEVARWNGRRGGQPSLSHHAWMMTRAPETIANPRTV